MIAVALLVLLVASVPLWWFVLRQGSVTGPLMGPVELTLTATRLGCLGRDVSNMMRVDVNRVRS